MVSGGRACPGPSARARRYFWRVSPPPCDPGPPPGLLLCPGGPCGRPRPGARGLAIPRTREDGPGRASRGERTRDSNPSRASGIGAENRQRGRRSAPPSRAWAWLRPRRERPRQARGEPSVQARFPISETRVVETCLARGPERPEGHTGSSLSEPPGDGGRLWARGHDFASE